MPVSSQDVIDLTSDEPTPPSPKKDVIDLTSDEPTPPSPKKESVDSVSAKSRSASTSSSSRKTSTSRSQTRYSQMTRTDQRRALPAKRPDGSARESLRKQVEELYSRADTRVPRDFVMTFAGKARTEVSNVMAEAVAEKLDIKIGVANVTRALRLNTLRDAMRERVQNTMSLDALRECLTAWPKFEDLLVQSSKGVIVRTLGSEGEPRIGLRPGAPYSRSCPGICLEPVSVHGRDWTLLELIFADLLHSTPKLRTLLTCNWGGGVIDIASIAVGPCNEILSGGIYGLFSPDGCGYVGTSNCVQRRDLEHELEPVNQRVAAKREEYSWEEWKRLCLIEFDVEFPPGANYVQEMMLNVLAGATDAHKGLNVNIFDTFDTTVLDPLEVIILYEGARALLQPTVELLGTGTYVVPNMNQPEEWVHQFGSLVDANVSGFTIRDVLTHKSRTVITSQLEPLPGIGTTRATGGRMGAEGIRAAIDWPRPPPSSTPRPRESEPATGSRTFPRTRLLNNPAVVEDMAAAKRIKRR